MDIVCTLALALALALAPVIRVRARLRARARASIWEFNFRKWYKRRCIELPHKDPADRFIAATAWENDLMLITEDEILKESKQIKLFKTA